MRLISALLITTCLWIPGGHHSTRHDIEIIKHYITIQMNNKNSNCAWWKCNQSPVPKCPVGKVCAY